MEAMTLNNSRKTTTLACTNDVYAVTDSKRVESYFTSDSEVTKILRVFCTKFLHDHVRFVCALRLVYALCFLRIETDLHRCVSVDFLGFHLSNGNRPCYQYGTS